MIARRINLPGLIIPVVIFIIAKFIALFLAYAGNCHAGFGEDCWVRWDSGLYFDVANNGHTLFHCGPVQGYSEISKTDWCGNAGWATLYPLFMKIFSGIFHTSLADSGIILSALFFLLYLWIMAKLSDVNTFHIRNWLIVGILAFCPGNIYFHSVFPLSQVAFFLGLMMYGIKKNKFLLAGIASALAILSYSIGFFLLGILAVFAAILYFKDKKNLKPYLLKTLLPAVIGLSILFIYDHFSTGHWNALFMIQSKYGHSLHNPFELFMYRWNVLFKNPYSLISWVEIQNLFMVFYILFLIYFTLRQKNLGPFRFFAAFFQCIFWFLPYSAGTDVGLYRNAATVGPGHHTLKSAPLWVLGIILVVFLVLSYPLGILFIQSTII